MDEHPAPRMPTRIIEHISFTSNPPFAPTERRISVMVTTESQISNVGRDPSKLPSEGPAQYRMTQENGRLRLLVHSYCLFQLR